MGSKSGSVTTGYKYFFDLQFGIGRPVDQIVAVKIGDVLAWEGPVAYIPAFDNPYLFTIDQPNLFGGDQKEGGVQGNCRVFFGGDTQAYDADIKANLGGLVPDFRGVTTIYYSGEVCANNPYPKEWKFRVRRNTSGWYLGVCWYPAKAIIYLGAIWAQNPIHIIYECLTNPDWGRGMERSFVDISFNQIDDQDGGTWVAAANQLCAEGFGMCIAWDRQNELNDFIQNVINHIGATMYVDRQSGLLCIKLIRKDYDVDDLVTFDATSGLIKIEEDSSGAASTINEVVVTYVDPLDDGKQHSTRYQDGSAVQANNGAVNSVTTQYLGLPTHELAQRIAQRDCAIGAAGLRKYNITLDRRGWKVYPGMPFIISAPERGIASMVVRAGAITDSKLTDGSIQVGVTQDIYGLPDTTYNSGEGNNWSPPDRTPVVIATRKVMEATYRNLVMTLDAGAISAFPETSGAIATLAGRPTNGAINYSIDTKTGVESFVVHSRGDFAGHAVLTSEMDHYTTDITFGSQKDDQYIGLGQAVLVGDEFCRIDAFDLTAGTMTVARGCTDTLPAPFMSGTVIWFPDSFSDGDTREYVASEIVSVKLLCRTTSAELDPVLAPQDDLTIAGRQGMPYAPGNMQINGTPAWNAFVLPAGDVTFTWAERNRVTQADMLIDHGAATITPETGTTYTVRIYDDTDVLLDTVAGITGTSWVYTTAIQTAIGNPLPVKFQIESVRDSIVSWDRYNLRLQGVSGFDDDFDSDFDGTA